MRLRSGLGRGHARLLPDFVPGRRCLRRRRRDHVGLDAEGRHDAGGGEEHGVRLRGHRRRAGGSRGQAFSHRRPAVSFAPFLL